MQILNRLFFWVCSFLDYYYKDSLEWFFGSLVLGCFTQVFDVMDVLLLLGWLGLNLLLYGCHCISLSQFVCNFMGKPRVLKSGHLSKNDFEGKFNSKIPSCDSGLKCLKDSKSTMVDNLVEIKTVKNGKGKNRVMDCSDDGSDADEYWDDDEIVDVMNLRKLIKKERSRANAAYLELEKDRLAATSAAEEAMAMILRLQNEKSLIEIEANQFRRLAEEKQQHDREVIESLRWMVMKYESEMSSLEDHMRLCPCRQNAKLYPEGNYAEEIDRPPNFSDYKFKDGLEDILISSLDMDLSPK